MPTPPDPESRQPIKLQDPFSEWMLEVTIQLERLIARVEALEKSTDYNSTAVLGATAAASSSANALSRIARAEEERLANDKEDRKNRDAWLARVWSSNAFQLLLVGASLAVLNLLGFSYIADRLLPAPVQVPVQAPSSERTP